jgi:hypothetical protein
MARTKTVSIIIHIDVWMRLKLAQGTIPILEEKI